MYTISQTETENFLRNPSVFSTIKKNDSDTSQMSQNLLKKGIKILMVEDSEICQIVQRMLLEEIGCIVDIASAGYSGIEMFHQGDYDALVLDINLPDISGIEVCKAIRETQKGKDIPIIGVSVEIERRREACMTAGFNQMILKEVMDDMLEKTLIQYFPFNKN